MDSLHITSGFISLHLYSVRGLQWHCLTLNLYAYSLYLPYAYYYTVGSNCLLCFNVYVMR